MNWKELPLKKELFELLRNGRHLSLADGSSFRALCDNEDLFREFFGALGFNLVRHDRDFFYFQGSAGGLFSARAAVFFFILAEWVSDNGGSVSRLLFEDSTTLEKLPHLERDRYRKYMQETGIDSEEGLVILLKKMEKLGFIEFENESAFVFRSPAFRFLDLCTEIKAEEDNDDCS